MPRELFFQLSFARLIHAPRLCTVQPKRLQLSSNPGGNLAEYLVKVLHERVPIT